MCAKTWKDIQKPNDKYIKIQTKKNLQVYLSNSEMKQHDNIATFAPYLIFWTKPLM